MLQKFKTYNITAQGVVVGILSCLFIEVFVVIFYSIIIGKKFMPDIPDYSATFTSPYNSTYTPNYDNYSIPNDAKFGSNDYTINTLTPYHDSNKKDLKKSIAALKSEKERNAITAIIGSLSEMSNYEALKLRLSSDPCQIIDCSGVSPDIVHQYIEASAQAKIADLSQYTAQRSAIASERNSFTGIFSSVIALCSLLITILVTWSTFRKTKNEALK